jgi:hypothetical protein
MTQTCSLDSGSATDCQPLCHEPATHVVVQAASGGYGPFEYPACKRHVRRVENVIFPGRFTTKELPR